MKNLKNAPLFFYVLCFLGGSILGSFQVIWLIYSLLGFIVFASFFLLFKLGSYRFQLFFFATFFFLGYIRMQDVFPTNNQKLGEDKEVFVIMEIEQQLRKGDKWETNIGAINSVLFNGRWERTNERTVLISEISNNLLRIGDKILVKTKIKAIENLGNPGEFDAEYYWLSKGVRYQCFGFTSQLKILESNGLSFLDILLATTRNYISSLFDEFIGTEQSDVVKAIFLGDKSDLDIETKSAFANAGAMHVLAVSGLHVGIITLIILWIFQHVFVKIKRNWAVFILILLLWGYAFITGFSSSVTRAVLMFSMLGIAEILGRTNNPINTLAFSALVLIVWNPICIFDIGFQLSYLAVLGIFLTYSPIEKLFYIKNKWLKKLWQGTAVGLSAQIFTIPISLFYFHQFPNYFMLSNLPIMLFAGAILGGSIALFIIGKIPFINSLVGLFLFFTTFLLTKSIEWIEKLPGAVALGFEVSITLLICSYLVIILLLFDTSHKRRIAWVSLLLPLVFFYHSPRYENTRKNELCVFNSKATIFLAKVGKEQICFYDGDERAKKEAVYKIKDYQKIYPGNVSFVVLDDAQFTLKNQSRSMEVLKNKVGVLVTINYNKRIQIVANGYFSPQQHDNDITIIKSSSLKSLSGSESLDNSAFQMSIK